MKLKPRAFTTLYIQNRNREYFIGFSNTVLALFAQDNIFMNFTKAVALHENIIMNSCASFVLLHLKQSAS